LSVIFDVEKLYELLGVFGYETCIGQCGFELLTGDKAALGGFEDLGEGEALLTHEVEEV
jgi:hypothetical protein